MDARAVDDLLALARHDAELAARTERLRELDAQVAQLRARAEAIDAFFASYPDEETRRRAATTAAAAELSRRLAELAQAERDLATARDAEARERAGHAVDRARDHVAVAETTLERMRSALAELERDASSLPEEVGLLEESARTLAGEASHLPPPPRDPRELVEWASHAHAELFVAIGQVDAQRERVIREANELATMLLGEPTYGSTAEQLAQRVVPLAGE